MRLRNKTDEVKTGLYNALDILAGNHSAVQYKGEMMKSPGFQMIGDVLNSERIATRAADRTAEDGILTVA